VLRRRTNLALATCACSGPSGAARPFKQACSVQRDQNRVRVNAQLIDAASGAHLWAERFEEDLADVFKLQDQTVARLGNTLGIELVRASNARSSRPPAKNGFGAYAGESALYAADCNGGVVALTDDAAEQACEELILAVYILGIAVFCALAFGGLSALDSSMIRVKSRSASCPLYASRRRQGMPIESASLTI
jgi:hypothetical protein